MTSETHGADIESHIIWSQYRKGCQLAARPLPHKYQQECWGDSQSKLNVIGGNSFHLAFAPPPLNLFNLFLLFEAWSADLYVNKGILHDTSRWHPSPPLGRDPLQVTSFTLRVSLKILCFPEPWRHPRESAIVKLVDQIDVGAGGAIGSRAKSAAGGVDRLKKIVLVLILGCSLTSKVIELPMLKEVSL